MEKKGLGNTAEKIPELGMGTWNMGQGAHELDALKEGLKLGDRFIDTAEIYGTEPLVARAIKGERGVFVASKVWPSHHRRDDVIKACDNSLRRLGIKCIDLYQLHWPNYTVPIDETMAAMEQLQSDGKIKHIGVSNFSQKEFEEARSSLSHSDIASNQIEYSVIMREYGDEFSSFANREKVTIIAYSPLGTGAFFDEKRAPFVQILADIGSKYNASAVQVALNWLTSKDNVIAIPKASSVAHVRENIGSADFKLSASDMKLIDEESKRYQKHALVGRHLGQVLKHTKFWHGMAGDRYVKK